MDLPPLLSPLPPPPPPSRLKNVTLRSLPLWQKSPNASYPLRYLLSSSFSSPNTPYTLQDAPVWLDKKEVKRSSIVGKGTFAVVYRCVEKEKERVTTSHTTNNTPYRGEYKGKACAIKQLLTTICISDEQRTLFIHEAGIMAKVSSSSSSTFFIYRINFLVCRWGDIQTS